MKDCFCQCRNKCHCENNIVGRASERCILPCRLSSSLIYTNKRYQLSLGMFVTSMFVTSMCYESAGAWNFRIMFSPVTLPRWKWMKPNWDNSFGEKLLCCATFGWALSSSHLLDSWSQSYKLKKQLFQDNTLISGRILNISELKTLHAKVVCLSETERCFK